MGNAADSVYEGGENVVPVKEIVKTISDRVDTPEVIEKEYTYDPKTQKNNIRDGEK